jgi:hypothetical protein
VMLNVNGKISKEKNTIELMIVIQNSSIRSFKDHRITLTRKGRRKKEPLQL